MPCAESQPVRPSRLLCFYIVSVHRCGISSSTYYVSGILLCASKQGADDMRAILATLQSEGVQKTPLLVLLLKVKHSSSAPFFYAKNMYSSNLSPSAALAEPALRRRIPLPEPPLPSFCSSTCLEFTPGKRNKDFIPCALHTLLLYTWHCKLGWLTRPELRSVSTLHSAQL